MATTLDEATIARDANRRIRRSASSIRARCSAMSTPSPGRKACSPVTA